VLDVLMIVVGVGVIGISVLDSAVSWPANRVLVQPDALEKIVGFALVPMWIWMMASAAMVFGTRRGHHLDLRGWIKPRIETIVMLVGIAVLILFVLVAGMSMGGAKGSLRILPGGVHQVSSPSLGASSEWVTVSPQQYQLWGARFVREDAFLAAFGLALVAFGMLMISIRRHLDAIQPRSRS